jgi:hypothetical protein
MRLLPQRPLVGISQERVDRRARIRDNARCLNLPARSRRLGRLAQRGRQPAQVLVGFQHQHRVGFLGQHILLEAGEEARQLLVDLREPRLGRGVELGASAHKPLVAHLHEALLLGRELLQVGRVVHRLNALK